MANRLMFAFVDPDTLAVDPDSVSPEPGENRFEVVITGEPPHDRKTERPVAGPLYFNEESKTVRRAYVVRALTNQELAEQRGGHALRRLGASDQPMVRALEDAVRVLLDNAKISLDDERIPKEAAQLFNDRAALRASLE